MKNLFTLLLGAMLCSISISAQVFNNACLPNDASQAYSESKPGSMVAAGLKAQW